MRNDERAAMNLRRSPRPASAASGHHSHSAYTLVEILVAIAIIVIVLAIAVGSLRALTGTNQMGAARTMLHTLLASARAEASARGHLVGVRFQQSADGTTYGVIIWPREPQPPGLNYVFFEAAPNREPFRFPAGVELAAGSMVVSPDADGNASLTTGLANSTTFSIVFEPTGQLAFRTIRVGQRRVEDPVNPQNAYGVEDPRDGIFDDAPNQNPRVEPLPGTSTPNYTVNWLLAGDALPAYPPFLPARPGIQNPELTENSLWLYDQAARRDAGPQPWTNYLRHQQRAARLLINPYTGQLMTPAGRP